MKATTSQLSRSFCSNLAWEKFFGESFPGSSVHHPESGDEFYAEYSTWNLSSIRFVEIFSSVRFRVDGQPPREGEEFFFLTLPIAGKLRFQALGEPSQAGEHLLILADASKPHSVEYEAQTRFLALRIPKSLLCRYLDVVSTQLKFATKTGNGSSLLAWTLCKSIWDQKSNIRPDESRALSLTVTQLLASAFGAESGVMEYAGSSRTQRHFVRVCEYIDRNFMDPEFDDRQDRTTLRSDGTLCPYASGKDRQDLHAIYSGETTRMQQAPVAVGTVQSLLDHRHRI